MAFHFLMKRKKKAQKIRVEIPTQQNYKTGLSTAATKANLLMISSFRRLRRLQVLPPPPTQL